MAKTDKDKKKKKSAKEALKDADLRHYRDTEQYVGMADALYKKALDELTKLAARIDNVPLDKPFSFSHNKAIEAEAKATVMRLAGDIKTVIDMGARKEWSAACKKSVDYVNEILKTTKLTEWTLHHYQDRNLEGLAAFQERKVEGLNLSDRVWKMVEPMKDEVELAVDTSKKYFKYGINSSKSMTTLERAIGTGESAAELSRDVRQCLLEPNKLFRRVRDKYGNLHLSKAAQLYHPGQGVYRSSYKNAMRMTRSEINMAYRQSDYLRWQNLDFVVGFEVQTSNNHPEADICNELAGKYPKDFKFTGWHPQCRCFCTPIMKTREEMNRDRANMDDPDYVAPESVNAVKDAPENFKQYIRDNEERMNGWKSTPYYIKDNPQFVDKALHPEKYRKVALVLDDETQQKLAELKLYANNHQGSKKFATALDNALKAQQMGDQKAFDAAMAEMEAIRKKNEGSTASKAAKRAAAKEVDPEEELKKKLLADDKASFTDEQWKNIEEIEKAIGQKKGLRMSYEEANTGKENPHYGDRSKMKLYITDAKGHVIINPEYEKAKGYRINCQTCVMTHELRRRGFNVEAGSNYNDAITGKIYKKAGINTRWGKYLNTDGTYAESYWVQKPLYEKGGHNPKYDWMTQKGYKTMNRERAWEFLNDATKAEGRYEVGMFWRGGGAHVISAERDKDGKLRIFDPQSGKDNVMNGYLDDGIILKHLRVLRVDDKLINPKIMEAFKAYAPLPINVKQKTRAEEIADIAAKRHAARTDAQKKKITDFWAKRKEESQRLREEVKDIISRASKIDGIDTKALEKLSETSTIEKINGELTKIKAKVTAFEAKAKRAETLAGLASDYPGFENKVDAIRKAIESGNEAEITRAMEGVGKDIAIEKMLSSDKIKMSTIVKKYGKEDTDALISNTQRTMGRYSTYSDKERADKYRFEAQWSRDHKKYSTWEEAALIYEREAERIEKKILLNEEINRAKNIVSTANSLGVKIKNFVTGNESILSIDRLKYQSQNIEKGIANVESAKDIIAYKNANSVKGLKTTIEKIKAELADKGFDAKIDKLVKDAKTKINKFEKEQEAKRLEELKKLRGSAFGFRPGESIEELVSRFGDNCPETLRNLQSKIDQWRVNNKCPYTAEEQKIIERAFLDAFQKYDFGMNIKPQYLQNCFDEHFKNTFEVGNSCGYKGSSKTTGLIEESHKRWQYSKEHFGYDNRSEDARPKYEKYGSLLNPDIEYSLTPGHNRATQYGTVEVRFKKDKVIATFTNDDSLNQREAMTPSLTSDPKVVSLSKYSFIKADVNKLEKAANYVEFEKAAETGLYVELQYHGIVDFSCVKSVSFENMADYNVVGQEYIDKMKAQGVEIYCMKGGKLTRM